MSITVTGARNPDFEGNTVDGDFLIYISTPPVAMYHSVSGSDDVCEACTATDCKACVGAKTQCDDCYDGYRIVSFNCDACVADGNCKTCLTSTTCDTCPDNYYLDAGGTDKCIVKVAEVGCDPEL